MNISLIDLYNYINNKSNNMDDYMNNVKSVKKLDSKIYSDYKFNVTNYAYNDTLNNLIFHLMVVGIIEGYHDDLLDGIDKYDRITVNLESDRISNVKNNLIEMINDESYNIPFNKKKIIQLILSNEYNHELLLILIDKYDVNLYIYYKDINIFKLYYIEDKLNKNKQNIFLQYNRDVYTCLNTFQTLFLNVKVPIKKNKYILNWSDIELLITQNISNIYPIGIEENKKLIIDDNPNNSKSNGSLFFKKNDDNTIVISKYIVKDDEICDKNYYDKIIKS